MPFKSPSARRSASRRALQVLLVESEPATVMNVMRVLETQRPEWRVNVVRDRKAATRALSEASFDAVLIDLDRARTARLDPGALLAALEDHVLTSARAPAERARAVS